MKIIKILYASFFISILFISCETDVDLFTDGKQTPVVFALLEPASPVQYFRINPTFIGEGDARDLAGDPSVSNYAAGELEVKLINISKNREFIAKDSIGLIDLNNDGVFNVKNRIYYISTPVDTLEDGTITNDVLIPFDDYQLRIENLKTGVITTSDIKLGDINQLRMVTPQRGISQFPSDWMRFYSGTEYNKSYTFSFDSDILSERFLFEMDYYYIGSTSQDENSKDSLVNFIIGEVNEIDAFSTLKRITIDFNGESFYTILSNKLPLSVDRTGQTCDLIVTAVGPDLDIYISVQNSSLTSISQEQPSYSNITNGLGIFSFRLKKTFTEFKLSDASAKELFQGPITFDYFSCAKHGTQSNSQGFVACRN